MKTILFLAIFSFFNLNNQLLNAQQTAPVTKIETPSRLSATNFSYPVFFGNEKHTSFASNYRINNNLQAGFNVFFDTYPLNNRLRTSLELKRKIYNKLYILGGFEIERQIGQGLQVEGALSRSRHSVTTGFGYEAKENLILEARANYGLNKSAIGAFGESLIETPKIITLNGNWKF